METIDSACDNCQVECEIEWRARISLADAQKLILAHFRDQSDVWIDEYRVNRFAQYQRRVGSRSHYDRYTFSTIGDFLALHGLSPLSGASSNLATDPTACSNQLTNTRLYPFSELKTTNCAHSFYTFSPDSSLLANNRWPRIFVIKRSLEITHFESHYQSLDHHGDGTIESMFSPEAIQHLFADYQRNEMDRSDNNFGVAYVRKIYRLWPFESQKDQLQSTSHSDKDRLRLAVYSIFDEYQQIRYEVAIEYEFNQAEQISMDDKYWCPVSSLSTKRCLSSKMVRVSVDTSRLDTITTAISQMINYLVSPCVYYVEKPMIKINVDWLPGITSPAVIRMLSYQIPSEQAMNEENFANYVLARLKYLTHPLANKQAKYHYYLRRKLDGERLYATYDGGHLLCFSNGDRLDLRLFGSFDHNQPNGCSANGYHHLFSVDFIYQVEVVAKNRYFITEVVAARHSYSTVLNSLAHSFSPSKNFYRATDEQIWPYGLIGTGLDEHNTSSMIDFWVTSGCGEIVHGFLTKDIVEALRDQRQNRAKQASCCHSVADDSDASCGPLLEEEGNSIDLDRQCTLSLTSDGVNVGEEPEEEGYGTCLMTLNSDKEPSEEEERLPSVATTDSDVFPRKIGQEKGISDGKMSADKETKDAETHSRFFVPVCAKDSRYYLMMLNRTLLSLPIAKKRTGDRPSRPLDVNIPVAMASLCKQELIDYYRAYIIRILNILFLCDQLSRCIKYARKHFSSDYADEVESAFKQHHRCLSSDITIDHGSSREKIAIDGYLLYRERNDKATVDRYPPNGDNKMCMLPYGLVQRSKISSVLKLKPFQTIELLMRVELPKYDREEPARARVPTAISFLSQLRADRPPSVFFSCIFPATTRFSRGTQIHLCSIDPDFKLAKWKRYDEKNIEVFVDPRLELIDGLVYEFLCYNEFEFYLIKARPDKVLADDEGKISSILWSRRSSEAFFIL